MDEKPTNGEHPNLAAALVAALAEVPLVGADHKANAGSYSYDYADLAGVVKASRPVLAEHGVVALTPVVEHGDGLACTVILLHSSGERMDLGPFPFPHGKDAQATGSMVTYHRRYALLSALGMAVGDDDDGAAAKPRQKQQESRPANRQQQAKSAEEPKAPHPEGAASDIVGELIGEINRIKDIGTRKSAMKAFLGGFGSPPVVPDDQVAEARQLIADFAKADAA